MLYITKYLIVKFFEKVKCFRSFRTQVPKDFSNATSWTRYDFIIQCASVRQHMLYELTLTLSRVQKCPEKMGGNLDGQMPDTGMLEGGRQGGVRLPPDFGPALTVAPQIFGPTL